MIIGESGNWLEASLQFMFTLGAGIKALEIVFDTVIDTLVITALEM
jgi:hypothetical protein